MFAERPGMRKLFLTTILVVAALAVLHQAEHAHAGEHCGFWGSIEAGLSCR
jgi:hypothetical protein